MVFDKLFNRLHNVKKFIDSRNILLEFNPEILDIYKIHNNYINGINNKVVLKTFDNNSYIKHMIYENKFLDCYVIFWKPHALSLIHDHSDNGCLLKVLNGSLKEEIYNKDENKLNLVEINNLDKNKIGYIDNAIGYHRIINPTNSTICSIHIYSPPNYKANIFN
tara:strand:+ start:23 stop:514 length:492 start_codon:yes stop_codon:yes gene_type:complete